MKAFLIALSIVVLAAAPALASQCPALIKQVNDAVGTKTDDASKTAASLAAEAQKLHDGGKHAEAVAKAEEAAAAIKLTLKKK